MAKERLLERLDIAGGEHDLFKDIRFGVRALPAREREIDRTKASRHRASLTGLSIREIAERRLGIWGDEG